jgi:hypothetical protein
VSILGLILVVISGRATGNEQLSKIICTLLFSDLHYMGLKGREDYGRIKKKSNLFSLRNADLIQNSFLATLDVDKATKTPSTINILRNASFSCVN